MLSALMTTPPSSSASRSARPDLPLAVGPAIRMARALEFAVMSYNGQPWRLAARLSHGAGLAGRQRVVLEDQLLQPLLQHVRIDLCGGDVGVAEQLLHRAQVGAAVEQMAGEGVAQHVGR